MNLYNNINEQEMKLLEEANVKIEDKEYSQAECKDIVHSIVDYVMNFSKNDIGNNMNRYNGIIEKLS